LREFDMPLQGVIVNRVHRSSLADAAARSAFQRRLRSEGAESLVKTALASTESPPRLLGSALHAFVEQELQAAGDELRIATLRAGAAKGLPVAEVSQLDKDVYDLAGLKRIADCLFEEVSG
jgi:hypothetical protein